MKRRNRYNQNAEKGKRLSCKFVCCKKVRPQREQWTSEIPQLQIVIPRTRVNSQRAMKARKAENLSEKAGIWRRPTRSGGEMKAKVGMGVDLRIRGYESERSERLKEKERRDFYVIWDLGIQKWRKRWESFKGGASKSKLEEWMDGWMMSEVSHCPQINNTLSLIHSYIYKSEKTQNIHAYPPNTFLFF